MLALLIAAAATAHDASSIQWIENDQQAAFAKAAEQGKPVFVDFWATWCHSCLSMRNFIFTDAGMKPAASQAVFLSVETEQPKNRAFVAKYPIDGLPTFALIDPKSGRVLSRWLGSGTVGDLRKFVLAGRELMEGSVSPALQAMRAADERQMAGDRDGAVAGYEKALAACKQGDWFRQQLLDKLLSSYGMQATPAALKKCVSLGLTELKSADAKTASGADVIGSTAQCADGLKGDPIAKGVREKAIESLLTVARDPAQPLSADDRSDMLSQAATLLKEAGRDAEAKKATEDRRDLLLAAQKAAPDPEMASSFDAHLTESYIFLHDLAPAEALLAAREKELPDDYNPPARLARVLFEEKKLPEAEQAIDRAVKIAPDGPRKVGLLGLKAKILDAAGKDKRPALREQLNLLRSFPKRRPEMEKRIEKQLEEPHAAAQ